jgi:hypothetical protein
MSPRKVARARSVLLFVFTTILAIETLFFSLCANIKSPVLIVALAPIIFLALYGGVDICKMLLRALARKLPANFSQVSVPIAITTYLLVVPIPFMLVLQAFVLFAPIEIGSIDSLFEAWKMATRLSIVHGFLALCLRIPMSTQSTYLILKHT